MVGFAADIPGGAEPMTPSSNSVPGVTGTWFTWPRVNASRLSP